MFQPGTVSPQVPPQTKVRMSSSAIALARRFRGIKCHVIGTTYLPGVLDLASSGDWTIPMLAAANALVSPVNLT